MRKYSFGIRLILILAISLIMVAGCTPVMDNVQDKDDTPVVENEISLDNYFPFRHNTVYEYEGYGNEFAQQTVFLEYENGQRAQFRTINPGTETIRIVERTTNSINEIYLEGEFYHTENILSTQGIKNNVLLKEPLIVGNSWDLDEGYKREITDIGKEIRTPYGDLMALEVTTFYDEDRFQKNYYVKDIGLVAIEYYDGSTEVKTMLKDIVSGPYPKDIRLYYPVERDNEILTSYVEYSFLFNTNDHLENVFEDFFKNPVKEGLNQIISEDTLINSIFLDKGTWTVMIDFSSELLPGWNAGSSLEQELIKSIVNTLGEFYDTDKVYISIEGVPFESGHYGLLENEVFQVDTEGIKEYE